MEVDDEQRSTSTVNESTHQPHGNISFSSHRNNNPKQRVAIQSHLAQNVHDSQPKSFAAEMSKNKARFMMMQRQSKNMSHMPDAGMAQQNFISRGKAIPKNPLSISKKLALLKTKNAQSGASLHDDAQNVSLAGGQAASSRNHLQPGGDSAAGVSHTFEGRKSSDIH